MTLGTNYFFLFTFIVTRVPVSKPAGDYAERFYAYRLHPPQHRRPRLCTKQFSQHPVENASPRFFHPNLLCLECQPHPQLRPPPNSHPTVIRNQTNPCPEQNLYKL